MSTTRPLDIPGMLAQLANWKNQRVSPAVIADYKAILDRYPTDAVAGAIAALGADSSEFFPPLGKIIAEMARWLRGCVAANGRAPVLAPDEAWHLARLTISRYQPQSRPQPTSGNPAIDGALRQLGGVAACQWGDAVAEGIVRRRFLEEYERQIATPEHIAWALSPAATAPPVVEGLELPDREVARLLAEAEQTGRAEVLTALLEGPRRAAVLDGKLRLDPLALPPGDGEPPTFEELAAFKDEVRAGVARLAALMRLPRAVATPPPVNEGDPSPTIPVADVTPLVRESRLAGAWQRDQLADRRERYPE